MNDNIAKLKSRLNLSAVGRAAATLEKKDKKKICKSLKYPIMEYPKFVNKNYETNTKIETQYLLV